MLTNEIERNTETILERIASERLSGKSVLLTGASGLLGSQLLDVLKECPLARLSVQTRGGLVNHDADELRSGGIEVIYADLANEGDCGRLPWADIVISAASYAQPLRFLADPLHALRAA